MSKWMHRGLFAVIALFAVGASGCGDYVRQGRGPTQAVVASLEAASGAAPDKYGGTLSSDVITYVKRTVNGAEVQVPTIFSDPAKATVSVDLKAPGDPGAATQPTAINQVTFTRYHVRYIRADGRNAQGVDIPYEWDSAVTFTVTPGTPVVTGFELVRVTAKTEAPLVQLVANQQFITTIAEITFYGKDHAGNDVTASGNLGITFGNFGDPQ